MFDANEISKLNVKEKAEETKDKRLNKILNKMHNYGYLAINLSDLNYILNENKYSIVKLKNKLHDNNIGYSWLIKNLKIPRATLSKILSGNRNIKLSTLNKMFDIISNNTELKISKQDLLN